MCVSQPPSAPQVCVAYASLRATDCKPSKARQGWHGIVVGAPCSGVASLLQHDLRTPCASIRLRSAGTEAGLQASTIVVLWVIIRVSGQWPPIDPGGPTTMSHSS